MAAGLHIAPCLIVLRTFLFFVRDIVPVQMRTLRGCRLQRYSSSNALRGNRTQAARFNLLDVAIRGGRMRSHEYTDGSSSHSMLRASSILSHTDLQVEPEFEAGLDELLDACRQSLRSVDEEMIRRAFMLGYWAHRNDRRASGERFITHPLEVAVIVARDIGFDDISVVSALLHDTVEDTEFSLDLIREEFGDTVSNIVDGLTKIRGVSWSRELGQAENVRKLMLSMATDVRVILIKFADRLHNLRTIGSLPKQKQLKIASETLDLFAPLAHRFGLNAIKAELEDISLKILYPEEYRDIARSLQASKVERDGYVDRFIKPLRERLESDRFDFEMAGRSKNIYSIWRKMKQKDKLIEEIYDLLAIRIVLKSTEKKGKEDCWRVYSIVTDLYKPLPERFRDFISVPKSNGYQSLHTTVLGPTGRRVEVQIRTEEMHAIAERGVAAHWKYKEPVSDKDRGMEQFLVWVRDILENPNPEHAAEFVKEFRLNLYDEEIYIFTPKGDLMTLPRDATPIDFAFQVHTEIGMHCIGAKVNGRMVPLSYKLQSGDQVEVITSKKQTPNPDWMRFVVTHKARSRIRHLINEKRRRSVDLGREMLEKKLDKAGLDVEEQKLRRAANRLKFPNTQQMFYEIGTGLFDAKDFVEFIRNESRGRKEEEEESAGEDALRLRYENFLDSAQVAARPALEIDGELHTDIVTRYASCCNPIPGDDVLGYISRSDGIKIHRMNCRNAPSLLVNHPDRIVSVEWSRQKDVQFLSGLRVIGEDRVGMVSDITTVISKNLKTNIRSITVDSEDGVFEGTIVCSVTDLSHLRRLIERLKRVDGIHGVYRFEE